MQGIGTEPDLGEGKVSTCRPVARI